VLGLRIITYFSDHVDTISSLIEREFAVDEENSVDKRAVLDPDRFGYLSTHYVVSIGGQREALSEWAPFRGLKFEIQIRSILQHSWAEIEHDLGYKSAISIPKDVRRRFSRLAGLLELADAEFASIRNQLADYEQNALEIVTAGEDIEINRDSISALVTEEPAIVALDQHIAALLNAELLPLENYYAEARSDELLQMGYRTVLEFVRAIAGQEGWIARFAAAWMLDDHDAPESDHSPNFDPSSSTWSSVPQGIGLLYAYRHLLLLRASEDAILDEFFDPEWGIQSSRRLRLIHQSHKSPIE